MGVGECAVRRPARVQTSLLCGHTEDILQK